MSPAAVSRSRAESPLVLTIDIGTSSSRVMLFDRLARPVHGLESRYPHQMSTTPDGGVEGDAIELVGEVCAGITHVLQLAGDRVADIGAVAIGTMVANVLGVDESGRPVTPVYTYADTRGRAEVEKLRRRLDEANTHERTGCRFHTGYLPARFLWIERERPESLRLAKRWLSIGEFLQLELFGRTACSYSVAAWTGMFNRQLGDWDREVISLLPIDVDRLSPLTHADQPLTGLKPEFAVLWPALTNLPWYPPVGDGVTSNIGSGCLSPRQAALNVGTSSAIRVIVNDPAPTVPVGLWAYRYDRNRSLIGGALNEGGGVFAWLRATFNLPDASTLEPRLAAMEPDAHGLTVLPFLTGERSPGWAADARAAIVGLSLHHEPADVVRATYESIAYRLATVLRMLAAACGQLDEVVASGGALLSSPCWCQIIADVTGQSVVASAEVEASSRGSALLALVSLGALGGLDAVPAALGEVYHPEASRHGRYLAARERQDRLYTKLVVAERSHMQPGVR
ncbi:MAG: gluconokinase [Chloroflexi bacterium]|nr:gluconokinase [Chloroflexota bacterium]